MKVQIETTRILKPSYDDGTTPKLTESVALSVFDKVSFDTHVAVIYAYRPPTPSTVTLETGLRKALSVYREWAGRLAEDGHGNLVVLLNDGGVRFVEAKAEGILDQLAPFKPSPSMTSLHPPISGIEYLLQVQLTRFSCGSLVIGFTAHHLIADGQATSNFLVSWGKACRGLDVITPVPLHDRSIFPPRKPPHFEFDHVGAEFKHKKLFKKDFPHPVNPETDIVVHKAHFTLDFLSKLKARASLNKGGCKPYSTVESLVAHLWRTVTRARGLRDQETTHVRIAVNGRTRLNPRVSNEYFGNLVLWAFPREKAKELLQQPLSHAAKLIHGAITKVDDGYFRSFIDFASHKVDEEDLVSTAEAEDSALCPHIEIDSWLRFPFYDIDFGEGCPYIFMPSYLPIEGLVILLPSFFGDGSIDAFVPLFEDNLPTFKKICYSLD